MLRTCLIKFIISYVTQYVPEDNASICVFNCLRILHCIITGLAGKNFAEAGCSFIGSMSRIQGGWLYNSECLLFFFP